MISKTFDIRPTSLRGWILKSLEQGEMLPDIAKVLLRQDKMEVNQKDETDFWDFKENINLSNPIKVAQLAKWILAFHNAGGGAIIVGVTNKFRVVGIHESEILDTVRLRNKISKYAVPDIGLFQGRIEIHDYAQSKKVIWFIFIPKRKNEPVPVAENGPNGDDNRPIIQKGQYYIRINDEAKLCVTPNDFERLFTGATFKSLSAYSYEVDEPFFRLLAPHHNQFIGRQKLLDEVKQALESRGYIISLDGVGGVGKSALAIELVRQLYRSKSYSFIVSLSAKHKIWVKHTETRQANFSGYTELLKEIAKVLELDTNNTDNFTLKQSIVDFMRGVNGLLLVDNIEEIEDPAVFDFLKNDIPEPVKIIVTSRISRDLPARTISVLGMNEDEALTLLQHELERIGYTNYINEVEEAKEITRAAGYLPLAIIWAASLVATSRSLHQVSSQLRKHDSTRREFLEFCFATMYDELSDVAREVSLLCPYLQNDWNTFTLSIALDRPIERIEKAINELDDRGILISNRSTSFSMLPLTADFLTSRWHENKLFREQVTTRIANSFASESYEGDLFNWPIDERVKVLRNKALELESKNELDHGLRIIRLALKWEEKVAAKSAMKLIEGRIIYKSGELREGLEYMQNACAQLDDEKGLDDEIIFFAQALLFHGKSDEQNVAMEKVVAHISHSKIVNRKLINEICILALRQRNYSLLSRLLENNEQPSIAYWICKEIRIHLDDKQIVFYLGEPVLKGLRLSLESSDITHAERLDFKGKADEISQIFAAHK
jgi:hypothetical protein